MFFTLEGYHRHLFILHKIRNIKMHPPTIYQKTVTVLNPTTRRKEDTFETKFTKLSRSQQVKEMKIINESRELSSSLNSTGGEYKEALSERREKWKRNHQKEENNPSTSTENEEKNDKYTECGESFFFQVGLDTHMMHAHGYELKNDTNDKREDTSPLLTIIGPKSSGVRNAAMKLIVVITKLSTCASNNTSIQTSKNTAIQTSKDTSSEVSTLLIFLAGTPKKTSSGRNKRNVQPKHATKITQKELRSSSRLQKKIEKKREEDSQPMPRWSERNIKLVG